MTDATPRHAEIDGLRVAAKALQSPMSLAGLLNTSKIHLSKPVQADDQLRLRFVIIKGDTAVDLDPVLAKQSSPAALELAEQLGE